MSAVLRMPRPARFNAEESEKAWDDWGPNCGPGALAGMLHLTLDDVRPHMGDFESKGYTNPTLMYAALDSLGVPWRKAGKEWPSYGLVRVQWHGPWMEPQVPIRARYRHTHWVGSAKSLLERGVFDINCVNNGSGWVTLEDWSQVVVPWLLGECEPKADGEWSIANAIELGEAP